MEKALWEKLNKKWVKHGRVYSDYDSPQCEPITRCLREFTGLVVVDIGCAEGRFTYDIAQVAKGWIGVDHRMYRYRQASITQKYIKIPGKFLHAELSRFIKKGKEFYNAMLASNVLYHVTPEEIELVRTRMLPKCSVVVMISKEYRNWPIRNKYKLNKYVNIVKFLEDAGFTTRVENVNPEHVAVVGRKE